MKNILRKINIPAVLTLLFGIGLMSGSLAESTAHASRFDKVPAIQVSTSKNQIGRYLHVIYAVGRPGFLNVSPIPYLDVIRHKESQTILITSEVVTVPSVKIEKTPGRGSYNMVIFTVSNSEKRNWVNADVNPNPSDYSFVGLIQKPQIDALGNPDEEKLLLFNF